MICTGQYSYRKNSVAGIGIFLITIAALLIFAWIWTMLRGTAPFQTDGFLILAVSVPLGCLGVALLRLYFRRAAIEFTIAREGVTYGTSLTPWTRIRGFAIFFANGHLHFCVGRTGLRPDLQMIFDAATTKAEAGEAIKCLRHFLEVEHPAIWIETNIASSEAG